MTKLVSFHSAYFRIRMIPTTTDTLLIGFHEKHYRKFYPRLEIHPLFQAPILQATTSTHTHNYLYTLPTMTMDNNNVFFFELRQTISALSSCCCFLSIVCLLCSYGLRWHFIVSTWCTQCFKISDEMGIYGVPMSSLS